MTPVILSRRRRISVRGEDDVIGIHAGAWCSPLPADWDLTAFPYLLFLPRSFAALRMTVGGGKVSWITSVVGWPLDSVILSRRRRISVHGEDDVIGIHAGAWCSPLPADWDLTAFPYLLFLPRSFAALRMTVGGGKVSWITSVVGWPLDSVILSRRRRISVHGEDDVIGIHAGAWCSPLPADWYLTGVTLLTVLTEILRCAQDDWWEAGRYVTPSIVYRLSSNKRPYPPALSAPPPS